jgi:uncharacterized protein
MIEQAEALLRNFGFQEVRVRHHELRTGHLARIEVGLGELPRLVADGLGQRVSQSLRDIGYAQVTVDLQGYRRGSTNEGVKVNFGVRPASAGLKLTPVVVPSGTAGFPPQG